MGEKISFFRRPAVQTIIASILCAVLGIFIGYIILLTMNAEHATEGMQAIITNFFKFSGNSTVLMKYM